MNKTLICEHCMEAVRRLQSGEQLSCPHKHATFSRKAAGVLMIRFADGYQPRGTTRNVRTTIKWN